MSGREALEAILQDVVVCLSADLDRLQRVEGVVYQVGVDFAATKGQRMRICSQI
jgi:hypothetical protein